jgi:hypothetical protein
MFSHMNLNCNHNSKRKNGYEKILQQDTFAPFGTSSLSSLIRSWISCLSLGRGLQLSPGLALFLLFLDGSEDLSSWSLQALGQETPLDDITPHIPDDELKLWCLSSLTREG